MKKQCSRCIFWADVDPYDRNQEDDKHGECRRFPSVFIPIPDYDPKQSCQDAAQWCQPIMYATDWCGEFKPIP